MFFFWLLLCQAIFSWLASFLRRFLFVFLGRALCSIWKNLRVQIIVSKKTVFVKISRIYYSKSLPWNLVKFRSEFFSVNVSRIVSFWLCVSGETVKTPGFHGNAHLRIYSICLKECSDEASSDKSCIWKIISGMKYLENLIPMVCTFDFWDFEPPSFRFIFGWQNCVVNQCCEPMLGELSGTCY